MGTIFRHGLWGSILSSFNRKRYAHVPASESKEDVLDHDLEIPTMKMWSTIHVLLMILATTALSGGAGFAIGVVSLRSTGRELMAPAGEVRFPMVYNRTFSQPPSPESDAAWASMFPEGVGFVKHPKISPELSGVAVFHELHCVNMLRVGYYAALDGTIGKMQMIHDHNKRPDPHHLRHCFDYLRQSLVCAADSNLEPVDFELGGVTGWSFQRTCRDFDRIKDWAEQWRSWDAASMKSE